MTSASIEEVTDFVLDGTHGSPERTETGVPVLSAQNVKGGALSYETDRFTSQAEYEDFSRRLKLQLGDVLLTIVGTIGRSAVVTDVHPLVFQRSVAVLRPKHSVLCPRFLFHVTQSQDFQAQLARAANKSSQAGIYLGKLKSVRFPLPPLPEQRRIATILDKANALRAKRREAIAKLDQLLEAVFLEMFGDPVTNPKGWPVVPLSDFGNVTTGNTPPRADAENYGTAIEWIKSDNLNTDEDFITEAEERLSPIGERIARIATANSILVTCIAGSPSCIGNLAIADRPVAFNQQINAVTPYEARPEFLYFLLKTAKPLIQAASTNGMKGMVSKSRFSDIQLPKPPVAAQAQFAGKFSAVRKIKAVALRSQHHHEEMFHALQQSAFNGTL